MKLECSGCKKVVSEEDFEECFAVYKCNKDHMFICCKVECHRIFEKRCAKVADNLLKMQHKLNNDGHTSALRRLPPCEREKFKQHAEAEANGHMICPEEVKACERSVPNCAHILYLVGGTCQHSPAPSKEPDDCPEAQPLRAASQGSQDQELVGDDMLLEIRRDDDYEDMILGGGPTPKAKKSQKGKKEKKGQPLLLDWKTPPANTEELNVDAWSKAAVQPKPFQPAPYTPAPARTPGGLGAAQWSAVASRLGGETEASRPGDYEQRAKTLSSTTGCTDLRAVELLESNAWNLDKAADAFFRQAPSQDRQQAATEGPRWGPRANQAQEKGPAKEAAPQTAQVASAKQESPSGGGAQPPAPSQPPPPRLPANWQAIWDESQRAYYYWHIPTNETTWDFPTGADESSSPSQAEQTAAAEAARREGLVSEAREITGIDSPAAQALLESHSWNLEAAIRSHVQQQEAAAKRRAEEEAKAKAAQATCIANGEYVCTQHWRPRPGVPGCIRVFQGERVRVSWTDEQGWAYGTVLEENRDGYFPQAHLKEAKSQPRLRKTGEKCSVAERFDAPEEVGGYCSVAPGDAVRVLHPSSEPHIWVYVERSGPRGLEVGWVPESLLKEERRGGPGPNPAG